MPDEERAGDSLSLPAFTLGEALFLVDVCWRDPHPQDAKLYEIINSAPGEPFLQDSTWEEDPGNWGDDRVRLTEKVKSLSAEQESAIRERIQQLDALSLENRTRINDIMGDWKLQRENVESREYLAQQLQHIGIPAHIDREEANDISS